MKREPSGTPPGSYRIDTSQLNPARRPIGWIAIVGVQVGIQLIRDGDGLGEFHYRAGRGDQNGDGIVVRTTLTKDRGQLPGIRRIETCGIMGPITGCHRLAGH